MLFGPEPGGQIWGSNAFGHVVAEPGESPNWYVSYQVTPRHKKGGLSTLGLSKIQDCGFTLNVHSLTLL
jgi:hypothetical protein